MAIIVNEPLSCNYCQRLTEPSDTHIFETCEHIFHRACIDRESPICPTCNPQCAICLDLISQESKVQLACNHIFHKTCRDKWIETKLLEESALSCPTCRNLIDKIIIETSSSELMVKLIAKELISYYTSVVDPELLQKKPELKNNHMQLIISSILRKESPEVLSNDLIHRTFLEACNCPNEALNAPMAINERAAPPFISNTVMVAMVLLLSFLYILLPSRA